MADKRFHLIYDTEFVSQIMAIEKQHHSLIRRTIESQRIYEPDVKTRNRKPMVRTTTIGTRWELRFGNNNQFRVFYSVYLERAEVHILAVGVKKRDRLFIGGKEADL